jgi:dienelactone hydrolase
MRFLQIIPVLFLLSVLSCTKETPSADTMPPDNGLYVSGQFSNAQLSILPNVKYGEKANFRNTQYTSIQTKEVELKQARLDLTMDIAIPPNASASSRQPLLVLIHGGGFVTGDKSDMYLEAYSYAQAGYVVATINYRLTQNQSNDTTRLLSRLHALEDVGNAIRYLKKNATAYFIDTTRILSIGSSAGGGLSIVNAIERDAATSTIDYPGYSTYVCAAISTGATLKLDDIAPFTPGFDANDSPLLMFHANPLDSGTGATWQDLLNSQKLVNDSGNTCEVFPQPNMTHTVSLELGGTYWPQLKPFLWKQLKLSNL